MLPTQTRDLVYLSGLPPVEEAELFTIDLMGTTLSFRNPARGMKDEEWLRGFPIDERPFINTVSKSAYSYYPPSQRGACDVYQSGWLIRSGRWWKKKAVASIRFHLSLETPAADEYERFLNLLNEDCLREWLQIYYRERQAIFNQVSFDKTPEGHIVMIFNDDEPDAADVEAVPIQPFSGHRCELPGFFVYLNPGIVELNLPVGRRDIANFRFQLKFLGEPEASDTQVKELALSFISNISASVDIRLSEEEARYRTAMAQYLPASV